MKPARPSATGPWPAAGLRARRMFLTATALYQARKAAEGDAILAKVMDFMRTSSLWLFHMREGRRVLHGRRQRQRQRGPGGDRSLPGRAPRSAARRLADRPHGIAGYACVPHGLIFEHWFEAAVARKDHELAMEVADRARRHRFLSHLAAGRAVGIVALGAGSAKGTACRSRPFCSGRNC